LKFIFLLVAVAVAVALADIVRRFVLVVPAEQLMM
jgi:hypothetical protein